MLARLVLSLVVLLGLVLGAGPTARANADAGPPPAVRPGPPHPTPRLPLDPSRVAVSSGPDGVPGLFDGLTGDGAFWKPDHRPTPETPEWVAINLGTYSYQSLLLKFDSPGSDYFDTRFGAPRTYAIEVSANSSNGADGDWTQVERVVDNTATTRVHLLPNVVGARWVRLTFTDSWNPAPPYPQLFELALYDASAGPPYDYWVYLGDSILEQALWGLRVLAPPLGELVGQRVSGYTPIVVNAAHYSYTARDELQRLDAVLPLHPWATYVAIGVGTNDAAGMEPLPVFQDLLGQLIDKTYNFGKVPLFERIPFSTHPEIGPRLPAYNQVLDQVVAARGLSPGPDPYAYFQQHPDEILPDQIHPTPAGDRALRRLWADTMAGLIQAAGP